MISLFYFFHQFLHAYVQLFRLSFFHHFIFVATFFFILCKNLLILHQLQFSFLLIASIFVASIIIFIIQILFFIALLTQAIFLLFTMNVLFHRALLTQAMFLLLTINVLYDRHYLTFNIGLDIILIIIFIHKL